MTAALARRASWPSGTTLGRAVVPEVRRRRHCPSLGLRRGGPARRGATALPAVRAVEEGCGGGGGEGGGEGGGGGQEEEGAEGELHGGWRLMASER